MLQEGVFNVTATCIQFAAILIFCCTVFTAVANIFLSVLIMLVHLSFIDLIEWMFTVEYYRRLESV